MNIENDKNNDEGQAAERAAQHLANLLGTGVAGHIPESPDVDLEYELFIRRNVSIAALVILSAVIKSGEEQRTHILRLVKPQYFSEKSLERYLLDTTLDYLKSHNEVSIPYIEAQIPDYGPKVFGEQSNELSHRENLFIWSQILQFSPTPAIIDRAIELRRMWAKHKGIEF